MIGSVLRVVSLFSGSSGNCTLVGTGEKQILIDAGGTAKSIENSLNHLDTSLSEIDGIYVTHEHGDHTGGLAVIAKRFHIPIHMTSRSATALRYEKGSALEQALVVHAAGFRMPLGKHGEIVSFIAPHDSAECVGYRINCEFHSVGIVTDIGYASQTVYDHLCGCEAVMIESNHDKTMVMNGNYAPSLKKRILSGGGHLSNDDCAELAAALARQGTKSFLLAHLSRENNTPEAAYLAVNASVASYGAKVSVANPHDLSVLL